MEPLAIAALVAATALGALVGAFIARRAYDNGWHAGAAWQRGYVPGDYGGPIDPAELQRFTEELGQRYDDVSRQWARYVDAQGDAPEGLTVHEGNTAGSGASPYAAAVMDVLTQYARMSPSDVHEWMNTPNDRLDQFTPNFVLTSGPSASCRWGGADVVQAARAEYVRRLDEAGPVTQSTGGGVGPVNPDGPIPRVLGPLEQRES